MLDGETLKAAFNSKNFLKLLTLTVEIKQKYLTMLSIKLRRKF